MPTLSFEKVALLPKSCRPKIQLAVLLLLVALDQLVTVRSFSEYLIERKKNFGGRYSFLSSVLLTKFGLSVSSV